MPRVNIWLPADLHRAAKAEQVPISQVAQQAIRRELDGRRRADRLRRHLDAGETQPTRRQ